MTAMRKELTPEPSELLNEVHESKSGKETYLITSTSYPVAYSTTNSTDKLNN